MKLLETNEKVSRISRIFVYPTPVYYEVIIMPILNIL
jgi:hypothetical protein